MPQARAHVAVPLLLATALMVAALPSGVGAATRQGRRLRQVTAVATSRAVATQGSTAISNVRAGAVSTGQPTTAVAQGASISTAGQTVITDCNVYAENTEQYRTCINTSPTTKSNVSANATAAAQAGVVSWSSAPTCSPPVANYNADSSGRLWGYQNGTSCAFRFPNGQAVYAANLTGAGAAAATGDGAAAGAGAGAVAGAGANVTAGAAGSFEAAPACTGNPTPATSTRDSSGRLWGFQNGSSCAYKDASGAPLTIQGAGAGTGRAGGPSTAEARSNATAVASGGGPANAAASAEANANAPQKRRRHHRA